MNIFTVHDVSDLDMAFPADVTRLMPKWEDIPTEFKYGHGKWNQLVSDWFFCGLRNWKLTPKDGIDQHKALRHLMVIIGSFEPQHEHKEAACAYLLSQWFSDATWERSR